MKIDYIYIGLNSIKEIQNNKRLNFLEKLEILSLILRLNILYSIQKAGSGHLGSSLSVLDIFLTCYEYFKKNKGNFFSSKGHDAPALYNVMTLNGQVKFDKIHSLRRINGLPGHPDVNTKNIMFNTGSLGMGISKINGLSYANKYLNSKEKNIVILGDGELQEGQNWEALMFLQNNLKISPLIIIDHNKIQSDTWIKKVKDYSELKRKIKSFKLNFKEVDGHNKLRLHNLIKTHFNKKNNRATIILANTIKGKGFSIFESTKFKDDMKFYPFHSGKLPIDLYEKANKEILNKIKKFCTIKKVNYPKIEKYNVNEINSNSRNNLNLIKAYSNELKDFVKKNRKVVVLDADLAKDAGSSEVMLNLPKQFIEFGIAEQDMVSFGSGLASKKFLPIFHSFSCFLSTRAQEQIFNFCSENRKGIFLGALSGLTPSAPGHSHQMIRDIPLIGSMPNLILLELFSQKMIKNFFSYQKKINKSFFIKINNSTLLKNKFEKLTLPKLGNFIEILKNKKAKIVILCQGADVINEFFKAYDKLIDNKNLSLYAVTWLNKINKSELLKLHNKKILIFQSSTEFGSYDSFLSNELLKNNCKPKKFKSISIKGIPACGSNEEVLNYHKLSFTNILKTIKNF